MMFAFYLCVCIGAYAPHCTVSELPRHLVAGTEISLTVTVKDALNQPWSGPIQLNVDVTGVIVLANRITKISFPGSIEPIDAPDDEGSIHLILLS